MHIFDFKLPKKAIKKFGYSLGNSGKIRNMVSTQ